MISGFVVIIRYTSVIAYMKFLDPSFSSVLSRFGKLKCRFGERRGSSCFCLAKILGFNNEGKGRVVPEFLFWLANIW